MNGFLVDTHVISEFTKAEPQPRVIHWLDSATPTSLFASVVTLGELRIGAEMLPPSKRRTMLELWLQKGLPSWFQFKLLPVTKPIAGRCDRP